MRKETRIKQRQKMKNTESLIVGISYIDNF